MSEERTGQEPGEPDDLELDGPEDDLDPDLEPEPDESEPEPEPEPESEPSASSRTQQRRLRRESQEYRELREQNRRLTEALMRQPAQPQYQPQLDPVRQAQLDQQERDRVAQMPFEEQGRYWADKRAQELNQRVMLNELRMQDMIDRQEFKQILREERYPARFATEVEDRLSQARRNNMNPTREQVLNEMLGAEYRMNKGRAVEKQRQRGQRRIASQTVRPGNRASTAAVPGGRRGQNQDAEDEALLRSVTWGEVNR